MYMLVPRAPHIEKPVVVHLFSFPFSFFFHHRLLFLLSICDLYPIFSLFIRVQTSSLSLSFRNKKKAKQKMCLEIRGTKFSRSIGSQPVCWLAVLRFGEWRRNLELGFFLSLQNKIYISSFFFTIRDGRNRVPNEQQNGRLGTAGRLYKKKKNTFLDYSLER